MMPSEVITGETTLSTPGLLRLFLFQGSFSCPIKQGRIPSSAKFAEGWQGRSAQTHTVRGVGASNNHQTGAREITGASRPPAGSSYGNAELKEVLGEGLSCIRQSPCQH